MCTAADSGEIIILSSDDDDDEGKDMSCLIVEVEEEVKKKDCQPSPSLLEEDLVVTFSRHADVLPHARFDCPIHPFTPAEMETRAPADSNQLICDQCFCYICDELASLCKMWSVSGICHCNSHKRSTFWSNLRNQKLLGGLTAFNLTLSEIDSHLRLAELMVMFQQIQDLIPYFMCMAGNFSLAFPSLSSSVNGPASRFTPELFLFYLRVFETATAPKLTPVSKPEQLCCPGAVWESIKDAVPLKRPELVKFALRVQRCCSAVYVDSQCWTSLLTIVSKPMPMPSLQFLQESRDVVHRILLEQKGTNMQIPRSFHEVYPDQSLLLLVTGALSQRILYSVVHPVLPVLNTFKENGWAFKWLCDSLSSNEEHLKSFIQGIALELGNTADGDNLLPFLRSIIPTLSSGTSSSLAVNLDSSQVNPSSQSLLAS
ncbi:uncharacterized protein LOC115783487 [Archocentrus centrarchus]|uniref:uncharacterized protein LOC115783487 n=1 Tax=Archocentrus centrarchus TaxID=63155 RepID=UPI0011EA32E1|nr:uncharacterized protein LOC115783487 [Archocentrus centrarchus]